MMAFFAISLFWAALYLSLLAGRRGQSGLSALRGWSYAHRGLHGLDAPENSMAAFRAALEAGYGIELDIHLMKDGNLAVIHDASLQRTAGTQAQIEDLTLADLENYRLGRTDEKIPLFSQVLALFAGRAPIIVELKSEKDNYAALCQAACAMLDTYQGPFCIESFDPRCIAWLRRHRPDIIRGQLSANFLQDKKHLRPWVSRFVLTANLFNATGRPDFLAYRFSDRKRLGVFLCRKLWGIQGVAWTIRNKEDYATAVAEDWIPIFEGFLP